MTIERRCRSGRFPVFLVMLAIMSVASANLMAQTVFVTNYANHVPFLTGWDSPESAVHSASPPVALVGGVSESSQSGRTGTNTATPAVSTFVAADTTRFEFPDGQIVDVPMPLDTMVIAATDREEQFQRSRAAGIEVSVRFDNRIDVLSGTADRLVFSLALDTHSANLFEVDIEQSTELSLTGERLLLSTVQWTGDTEDSHHRYGLLTISAPTFASGEELRGRLELRLRNVGRSDRVFEWTL